MVEQNGKMAVLHEVFSWTWHGMSPSRVRDCFRSAGIVSGCSWNGNLKEKLLVFHQFLFLRNKQHLPPFRIQDLIAHSMEVQIIYTFMWTEAPWGGTIERVRHSSWSVLLLLIALCKFSNAGSVLPLMKTMTQSEGTRVKPWRSLVCHPLNPISIWGRCSQVPRQKCYDIQRICKWNGCVCTCSFV